MAGSDPADTFRQEAQELLELLEQTLLDLEHDPGSGELIASAFRALHTIKGSGSMFGFQRVADFTHHVETAFDRVRKGEVAPSHELIALALTARDHIRRLIEEPEQAGEAEGVAILGELKLLVDGGAAPEAGAPAPAAAAGDDETATWRIRFRLPRDAMTSGNNPLPMLAELRGLGTATVVAQTDGLPAFDELVPTDCYFGWDVVLTTDQPRGAIESVFLFVLDEMELQIDRIETEPDGDERLGEILVERGDATPEAVEGALARQQLGELLVEAGAVTGEKVAAALGEQKLRREARAAKAADSIRVPAERLDELMDRVGELVIAQSRLKQVAAASDDLQVKSVAEEIERLALELRDSTMGVRMVPFGSLFGRFRRLIHDLSRELGKDIQLVTSGEETELDKTVIERLNDPLVHLIRNAVDHGLEDPAGRAAAGKPAQGRISLSARHAGAEVLISIRDDGRGLDRERIRARAEANGLIAPDARLTDGELFQMIFQPGFSTAAQVTNLSGRGVGMDVVKRTIEALRGTIDVASRPGDGAEVTLRLPLTLAIIDGLLVRVGNGRYVIPLSAVEECVELPPEEDARARGRSFLNIRDELVPFLRLRELFKATTPPDRFQKVVIVSSGEVRVGLVVDQVIGDHQTVIKSLSRLHADVETFSGATILGDGTVALILEVAHLVEYGQVQEERLKAAG
ncbi:two-component system, chemotaxis family, sensor kinase CheA [Tistlia consotensis]|uniref:Chemotaxis protein CheA n=1 Tax=Tistlia consotensis USBA 355 TaxID=560819 RepID=A0A1Y6CMI0_9PROT|nr:chemotaxis protein CheA [Tistlia consotensis]SMF75339.1 two-component system, chemotaxis family, sensor kinase CheA [Tistlia consotensis USBA 355]SNS08411.1 two-component system, chemotaxis family, sensor kinase CheA [Tistlia consotensis]